MTGAGLLGVALGAHGSGRQRYAEAMALYQAGRIGPEQLEAYRIAAATDTVPPATVFSERGLPLPDSPNHTLSDAIRHLIDEADRYLQSLPGPGVAETRAGIAAARSGPVTLAPHMHPVLGTHLAPALRSLAATHPTLAQAIATAAPHLNWNTYNGYPLEEIGDAFPRNHVAATILGQDAPIAAHDFDLGLFLIAPHILYRDHHHAAPELYAPLTGPHGWRFGPDTTLEIRPAHQPVWNPPHRPHLTKVGAVPFLCLYAWTGDVTELAHVIPAGDWPALEALRLDP